MKCPVCNSYELAEYELEPLLSSERCGNCEGNFIKGATYWSWLEKHGPNLPEKNADTGGFERRESPDLLHCPDCHWAMTKYRVGRGIDFVLDQCSSCKGIWLDRNEWETLKARNLHDDIHAMLTSFWQAEATREARRKKTEANLVNRFGEKEYADLKRFREWIYGHERKSELLAYLTSRDPLED
jgi:Zn-finger nucleic acid-binding protein